MGGVLVGSNPEARASDKEDGPLGEVDRGEVSGIVKGSECR
jgi:hypothetical protein